MGITREQALDCFRSDDLIGVGMEADAVRRQLHPDGIVSYTKCLRVDCSGANLLETVAAAVEDGATGVELIEAAGPEIAERQIAALQARFPALRIGGLSATVIAAMGAGALARLHAAGLAWLGGGDARILFAGVDSGLAGADWLAIHRAAHGLGMRSAAGMTFGLGETLAQRLDHLEAIRALQAETGGFFSFTPAALQHDVSAGGRSLEEATSVEVLKTLAICRMYLDTIDNVEGDWRTQGVKVLQMALRFGANDVGAVGSVPGESEEDLRRVIRDAGFRPVERDGVYGVMYLD